MSIIAFLPKKPSNLKGLLGFLLPSDSSCAPTRPLEGEGAHSELYTETRAAMRPVAGAEAAPRVASP